MITLLELQMRLHAASISPQLDKNHAVGTLAAKVHAIQTLNESQSPDNISAETVSVDGSFYQAAGLGRA